VGRRSGPLNRHGAPDRPHGGQGGSLEPERIMGDDTANQTLRALRRRAGSPPYDPRAYLLVCQSLSVALSNLEEPRHITARECADGVLELAARCFGVLGSDVLESWGIHSSEDIGRIIAALAERGVVSLDEDDRIEDFIGLFRVDEDFVARYQIGEGLRSRSAGHPGSRA
jgi:uncharacterized repeat protein (TIGR04138 family)